MTGPLIWMKDGERRVWQLSREQVWSLSDGQIRPLWALAAVHIRTLAGGDDPTLVVEAYRARFDLPPIRLIDTRDLAATIQGLPAQKRRPGEIAITLMQAIRTHNTKTGATSYWISHNPRSSWMDANQRLVVLRHEIEHIRDMAAGYDGGPEHPVEYDRATREVRILPGHHSRYTMFDYEWPHRMAIRQALAAGEAVPEAVLADYPDLTPPPPVPHL